VPVILATQAGGREQEDHGSRPTQAKARPSLKKKKVKVKERVATQSRDSTLKYMS
jgi:hypothetical protein